MTETAKHTSGPWRISRHAETMVETPAGRSICSTGGYSQSFDHERVRSENLANAALIAAAPDMLAALKAVHEPYRHLTEEALEAGVLMEFGPPKPEKGAALLLVRAAIVRAESKGACR